MDERIKAIVIELLRSGASKHTIMNKTGIKPSSLTAIMAHFTRGTYDNDETEGNGAQRRKQRIRTKRKRESPRHLNEICPPDIRRTISSVASSAKSRARKRGLEFEEDLSGLAIEFYRVQRGRCALTGKAFNLQKKEPARQNDHMRQVWTGLILRVAILAIILGWFAKS